MKTDLVAAVYHVTTLYTVSQYSTLYHNILHHILTLYMVSQHSTAYLNNYTVLQYSAQYPNALHNIKTVYIVSQHSMSHHSTLYFIATLYNIITLCTIS